MAYKSQVTITRPANTTAYTAGDVVGGAFQLTGLPTSLSLFVTSADLAIDVSAIPSGMTSFRLHLYDVTPASAIADNAAWDLSSVDRASYLGFIDLGSPADAGSTLYCEINGLQKRIDAGSTGVWAYLVTNGAFTPAGNSEVYRPRVYADAS